MWTEIFNSFSDYQEAYNDKNHPLHSKAIEFSNQNKKIEYRTDFIKLTSKNDDWINHRFNYYGI